MNKIIIENSKEKILDTDSKAFYEMISRCIGKTLDFENDTIIISLPKELTRNSKQNHLIYCLINKDRKVALKRCGDSAEYLRAEVIIDKAKRVIDLPYYSIIREEGVVLRNEKTQKSCSLLKGWEKKSFLVIDYGNPSLLKPIKELKKEEIHPETFFYSYGQWAAFNLIFVVVDRHPANFVISINDNILHSVDNEEIFFDGNGKKHSAGLIIRLTKSSVSNFIDEKNSYTCIANFRKGFVDCWNKIVANLSCFTMFKGDELEIIFETVKHDPNLIVKQFLV